VERPASKHNKRISYPVDVQNSASSPRSHNYNPHEYQQVQTQRRQQQQQQQQLNQYQQHHHHHRNSSSHHYSVKDPNCDQDFQYDHYQQETRNVTLRIKHYEKRSHTATQETDRRDSFQDNRSKQYYGNTLLAIH